MEFDLPSALLVAVDAKFSQIQLETLTEANASNVPNEQGVYCLFHQAPDEPEPRLVYIGKTDGGAGLRARLIRHAKKLIGRVGLSPADVSFKALRVFVFTAMDIETDLIRHHGGVRALAWNGSGFGSNDPGKERDTTRYKPEHFDTMFPIDLDGSFVDFDNEVLPVSDAMSRLKNQLPYLLRYESTHTDLPLSMVTLRPGMTTRQVLEACMQALPPGWHATALPSHIISYKNDNRNFPSGNLIARS
ncbi:MAG: hypothetical protein ACXIUV_07070 [Alkalilacustris sp.]